MSKLVLARNTLSGVTAEIAEAMLVHPHFSQFYVRVDSSKPEVFSQPYKIVEGERVLLDPETGNALPAAAPTPPKKGEK